MQEILELQSEMELTDLIQLMKLRFNISKATTSTYSRAPMFVTRQGRIRLRQPEEPYPIRRTPRGPTTKLASQLGHRRAAKLIRVTRSSLRGYIENLGRPYSDLLQLHPNDIHILKDPQGNEIPLTFPPSSPSGARLGSIKHPLKSINARLRDTVTVVIDLHQETIEIHSTNNQNPTQ